MAELYLHGLGYFYPENVIDNEFLENLDIDTNDEWITSRVGIKTRRTVLPLDYIKTTKNKDPRAAHEASLYSNAQTAKRAAEMALAHAGLQASDIGMVVVGGCAPQNTTPAEAAVIAAELGIDRPSIDLTSACSTFGLHMHFLSMMDANALPDYVLCVLPENITRTVDFSDRKTAVLWGDGTQATIVSTKVPSRAKIIATHYASKPTEWQKVKIPHAGHFTQEGKAVQTFAIKYTTRLYRDICHRLQEKRERLYFISHQANLRMIKSVATRCEIPEHRNLYNVDVYGNTGASGAPAVLTQRWQQFAAGDYVAMIVFGAGLSWSSSIVEFVS